MTDEKKKKSVGGGNGSARPGGLPIGIPLDPIQEQKRVMEEKQGQFLFLKLAKLLNIVPRELEDPTKPGKFRWMSLTFGNFLYDLTEVFEKAVEQLERIEKLEKKIERLEKE